MRATYILTLIVTSEQVGGEHHVLELRKVEAIEQAVVQVVHVRERTVVQPRPEVIQVRQVAGMAQSVIQALILAEQLADPAPNLGHTTDFLVVVSSMHLLSNLSRICVTSIDRSRSTDHKLRAEVLFSRYYKNIFVHDYITMRDCAHSATALHSALPPRSSDKSKRRHHTLYDTESYMASYGGETSEFSLDVNQTLKSI